MKTRQIRAVGAAVVAALLCAACGTSNDATESTQDTSASMSLGVVGAPTSFDPALIRVLYTSDAQFLSPVYDQLLQMDTDLNIAPGLATEWDMSEDGRALTLTLRTDVTFQDGSGFDSEVVKANIERSKTLPGSTAAPALEPVARVVTDGPDRVRLEFTNPAFSFPYTLAANFGISSMVSGQAIASGAGLSRTPAGSGPFTLTDYGQDRVTFTRDDDYWNKDDLPDLRQVTVISMPDNNARLNALQSGQISLAAMPVSQSAGYSDLVESGKLVSVVFPGQTQALLLNNTQPKLDDSRVRKALSLAIDRTAISQALFGGEVAPAYQFQTAGMPGYVPEIDEDDHYDPDLAEALLADAEASNLEFSTIVNGSEPSTSIATIVQDQLARIGVRMTIDKYATTEAGPAWRNGKGGSYSVSVLLGGDPILYLSEYLFGSYTLGAVEPPIAAAYDRVLALKLDDPARAEAVADLSRLLDEYPVHIPLVGKPVQYLATGDVTGLDDMTFGRTGLMPEIRVLGRTD